MAQEINIIPQPTSIAYHNGAGFSISATTKIVISNKDQENSAFYLRDYLKKIYGLHLAIQIGKPATGHIFLTTKKIGHPIEGAYQLSVSDKTIVIAGDNPAGSFYAVQSLIQLLPLEKKTTLTVPTIAIADKPRFVYRGLHLDVGRHFFDIDFIKKYIDYIASYKLNNFHWHLTEDQGWRIEIKKYPKLTQTAAFRNGTIIGRFPGKGNDGKQYGGFYTQEQVKEVVAYAAKRYITVIPEIELPGHSSAAIAAYPELSCFPNENTPRVKKSEWVGDTIGKQVQQTWGVFDDVFCPSEFTFKFLENVFDEVLQLFPSKYIHIGGDECPKEFWKRSAFCQQLIKEKDLKDEHGLQSYFIQRIEKYLNSKGRQIIGWDEILEGGLAPNATVMSWRGEKGGIEAAKQNHTVIMTPGGWCYFDHSQQKKEDSVTIGGYTTLEKVYSYEPLPAALPEAQHKFVLGAQANLWTEYVKNTTKAEYMLFPRLLALSEVLWSDKATKNWDNFEKKVLAHQKWFDVLGINYAKAPFKTEK